MVKVCVENLRKLKRRIQLLSQYNQSSYCQKLWKNLHPSQGLSFASITQVQDQDSSIREYYCCLTHSLIHIRHAQFLCFFLWILKFYSKHIWMLVLYLIFLYLFYRNLLLNSFVWDFFFFVPSNRTSKHFTMYSGLFLIFFLKTYILH